MFDSVLRRDILPQGHLGSGVLIAAVFYSGVAAFGAWAQRHVRIADVQEVAVSFFVRPAPPQPPSPPPSAAPKGPRLRATSDQPHTVLVQAIVAPTEIPLARPPEAEPIAPGAIVGAEAADAGYEVPAVPGGIVDPVVDALVAREMPPPEFDSRMTHPQFISGPNPTYTEKALEREVEGTMEVRCVVTVEGRVRRCRVLKSLPFMDRAVIGALERRVYSPATLGGRPIEIYYRFVIPLRLTD